MSDASDLKTHIENYENPLTLKQYTNSGGTSTAAVNETILLQYCSKAIRTFEAKFCGYDPANYPWHMDAAAEICMQKLAVFAKQWDEVKARAEAVRAYETQPVAAQEKRRRVMPYTEADDADDHIFDDDHFDGYLADNANT